MRIAPSHSHPEIKVSISLLTYNHKDFIREALESVLKQKVNFNYEIIIGDDCSSDGTRAILEEYQEKYPDLINLILHPRRYDEIPGRTNNITNIYACRGKYVAMLDGDDYWISENKLQSQVDFLEGHPDYSLCFHQAVVLSEENLTTERILNEDHPLLWNKTTFSQNDISGDFSFIPTSSILFRNHLFKEFPAWFWEISSADYALILLITQFGKAKFLKGLLSSYRVHDSSFSAIKKYKNIPTQIKQIESFEQAFGKLNFHKRKSILYYKHFALTFSNRRYHKAIYYAYKSLVHDRNSIKSYYNAFRKRL